MDINEIFAQALPLPAPWIITSSELSAAPAVLTLRIEIANGTGLPCPECERADCPVHDRVEKRWRHLNFWQHETCIHARVPRTDCPDCGVHLCDVPWARKGSGFTLLFEAMILALCSEMPVSACAKMVGEHDTRLWRIIHRYVKKAHKAKESWDNLGVDFIRYTAGIVQCWFF